ncbi:MAG: PIG-L family deacetylase [Planctomycetes bacterium]|nr:PIG-L family deacetylase [Planctomycetota bacterium]
MRSFATALVLLVAAAAGRAQEREPEAGLVALHQALLDAGTDAVVLNVAAHPDDESSRTNTILRRKYGMRVVTAYTTYGDGGQNAIGREIGPELAHLRVRETLRAAALMDVEVRWLGMDDFGFSKTLEETLAKWGEAPLRAAMRRIVDDVDPDFVLTNHSLTQGHGHHRATFWAIQQVLAERAARGDHVPALLARSKIDEAQWIVDPSELEPARGETYARLAHRAWTQHVTQGPWGAHNPLQVGRDWWRIANDDTRTVHALAGMPTAMPELWVRPSPAEAHERLRRDAAALGRRELLDAVRAVQKGSLVIDLHAAGDPDVLRRPAANLRHQAALDGIRLALANVRVEAWLDHDEVATDQDGRVNVVVHGAERLHDLVVRSGERIGEPMTQPVRALVFDGLPVSPAMGGPPPAGEPVPANAPTSPGPAGRFTVAFPCQPPTDGPEPRFVGVSVSFTLAGEPITVMRRLPYTPVPPVEIEWDREVVMVPAGRTVDRVFSVVVTGHGDRELQAPVRLSLPPGIQAVPIPSRLSLTPEHPQARLLVRATIAADELTAAAGIEVGVGEFSRRIRVQPIDVAVPPGLKVALVRGPDDSTERALGDLGVAFTALDRDALALTRLDDFTTVLLDIRAYHHRPELAEVRDRLLQFCRSGGRVVAMYHKPGEWNERRGHPALAPFPLVIGSERCTEEDAPVTLLRPDHRLLRHPHALAAADFHGWVQERGLNFPKTWDAAWTPLLSMRDAGDEKPHEGALLHTGYGQGDFVYCSLALYRQLRAGNAGAARLLVNLLAK